MAAASPIALIIGAGPNIGQAVARKFASEGYKVALTARSLNEADNIDKQLHIRCDASKTDDIQNAFAKVRESFGIPSVVVYNVSAASFSPADDPFAVSLSDFNKDTQVNLYSAFVAAQQAVAGFAQFPESAARAFLYTGNVTNVAILPRFMSPGIGKSAAAHLIWSASAAYKDKGYRFYYVDERKADGAPKYKVDGDAHANMYWELAHAKEQGPWMQTFVKGDGYKRFDSIYTPLS